MNQAIFNPWAAPILNGFNSNSPDDCEEDDHIYGWPETDGFQILTANERRQETLVLDFEDDFKFSGFLWSLQSVDDQTTPGFLYRIQDDSGKYICDGFQYCFATPGTLANPWPMFPHVTYSNHQRIVFEIENLADHEQGVQLGFRGMKRFRRARR